LAPYDVVPICSSAVRMAVGSIRAMPPKGRGPAALGSHDFGHQAVADMSLLRLGDQGHDARIGVTGDR
jgi:hypothetical protein